jgi:hypothetical protein
LLAAVASRPREVSLPVMLPPAGVAGDRSRHRGGATSQRTGAAPPRGGQAARCRGPRSPRSPRSGRQPAPARPELVPDRKMVKWLTRQPFFAAAKTRSWREMRGNRPATASLRVICVDGSLLGRACSGYDLRSSHNGELPVLKPHVGTASVFARRLAGAIRHPSVAHCARPRPARHSV